MPPKRRLDSTENRTLHLSALARDERRLHKEANATEFYFGRMLAERMMSYAEVPQVQVSERVRDVIKAVPEGAEVLDLRQALAEGLSESEIWHALSECAHASELVLSGWSGISERPLRAAAMRLGEHLKRVDLSNTSITNDMLEVFTSRLFVLQSLKLADCPNIGQDGMRAVAANCNTTLTSVDLSRSLRIDSNVLGWLAGTQGYGRQACRKLTSISAAECLHVHDEGLVSLGSGGCPHLAYVNFAGCDLITDKGVAALAKGCHKLKVLSLPKLLHLTDASLKILGKHCHDLASLNVSRSGQFTDAGLKRLLKGCPALQSLNIAGSLGVTERGLGYIAAGAPNLGTLNITGCQDITANGLRAAIDGNGYVLEARAFFGYYPKADRVDTKLADEQVWLETKAARLIQATWWQFGKRRAARAELELRRGNRAAFLIQAIFSKYKSRRDARAKRRALVEEHARLEMQRIARGHAGRLAAQQQQEYVRWLEVQALLWVKVQGAWRGYWCRRTDSVISRALLEMYSMRQRECVVAAAVFVQRAGRKALAARRLGAWRELKGQRDDDRYLASQRIQQCARMYMAYRRRLLLQAEYERILALQNAAASRIQAAFRGMRGKYNAQMTKAEIERLKRRQQKRANDIQRAYRGFRGREQYEMAKLRRARDDMCAARIQALFRGSRVLPWQGLKMNKVAAFVYRREELEMVERAVGADDKNQRRIILANRDSASGTESGEEEPEWVEFWDDALLQSAWYNSATNETRYEPPPEKTWSKWDFEESLVGCDVRVLWPAVGEWFRGTVVRFNKRKQRHRVDYPDGDHEWLDFPAEGDRIQVEDPESDGALVMFRNYLPPTLADRRARAQALLEKRKADAERSSIEAFWVCTGWDRDAKRMRWFNEATGQPRFQAEDSGDWVSSLDDDGCLEWTNVRTKKTKSVLDPDPRFVKFADSFETLELKAKVQGELSMGVYFCASLIDEYFGCPEDDTQARHKAMAKVLDNLTKGFLKLQAAVTSARNVYPSEEFEADVMCATAEITLKRYAELAEYGKEEAKSIAEKKKSLMKFSDPSAEKPAYHCPACRRPVASNEKFCPLCGENMPKKMVATPKEEILPDGNRMDS